MVFIATGLGLSSRFEPELDGGPILPEVHRRGPGSVGALQVEWCSRSTRHGYLMVTSNNALDYTLGQPIGHGSSSTVYSATYNPPSEPPIPCAVKVLDLDRLPPRSLRLLQQEATLMSLSKHPNVLRVRGTWAEGSRLYIAMRLMNKGSAADVMRYGWPGGMDEEVVRCILRQALQGLKSVYDLRVLISIRLCGSTATSTSTASSIAI